jgi:uncharacterized protein YwgA
MKMTIYYEMLSSTLNSVRRAEILSSFVKFLSEARFRFDPEDFDSRLKLQKYVFLASAST